MTATSKEPRQSDNFIKICQRKLRAKSLAISKAALVPSRVSRSVLREAGGEIPWPTHPIQCVLIRVDRSGEIMSAESQIEKISARPEQDIRRHTATNWHVLFGLVSDRSHCKPSRMGHDSGGFRLWWRQLTGSDATLDNRLRDPLHRPASVVGDHLGPADVRTVNLAVGMLHRRFPLLTLHPTGGLGGILSPGVDLAPEPGFPESRARPA
jgi:hypothetical protein